MLLTGGTGFFGPFLLASLLKQGTDDIYVLVRAKPDDAMRRIREGLASIAADGRSCPRDGSAACGQSAATWRSRTWASSDAIWRTLADKCAPIYHNGALVNYLLDYQAMRDANVGGTNEIIRLAMSRPRQGPEPHLHHVRVRLVGQGIAVRKRYKRRHGAPRLWL